MGMLESSFWPKVSDLVSLVSQSGLTHDVGLVEGGFLFSMEDLMVSSERFGSGFFGRNTVVRRWWWVVGLVRRVTEEMVSENGMVMRKKKTMAHLINYVYLITSKICVVKYC